VVADRQAAADSILRRRRNEPNSFANFKVVVPLVVSEAEEVQAAEALQALVGSAVEPAVVIGVGPVDPRVATLVEAEVVVVDSFDGGVCSEPFFYGYIFYSYF